jgi:hypothetical protein
MMQMLQKGGMEILTDNIREPDDNNTRGYYEYEPVKSLRTDQSWMHLAEDKAVKIIAQLLLFLPQKFEYSIIYMERNIDEILRSQQKMLEKMGQNQIMNKPEILAQTFNQQTIRIKNWLSTQPNIRTLYVNYRNIIDDPAEMCTSVVDFIEDKLNMSDMVSAVDGSMYRQRSD